MTFKRGPGSRVIEDKPEWTKTNTFGNYKNEQNEQLNHKNSRYVLPQYKN
jgi:hypothetical protein